jgi:hypothetical protein
VSGSKLLPDKFYDDQIERLSCLDKYPALPMAQKELRQTLRRISDTDAKFLQRLIGDVIDTHTVCPKPMDLIQVAERMRRPTMRSLGNPDCQVCNGSGWESFTKMVKIGNMQPYEANVSRPCKCRAGG